MTKVKVETIKPFERYKIGDKPELSGLKASTLEKMGLVRHSTPAALMRSMSCRA